MKSKFSFYILLFSLFSWTAFALTIPVPVKVGGVAIVFFGIWGAVASFFFGQPDDATTLFIRMMMGE